MSLIVFAAMFALTAQDPPASPDCLDDNHVDRCAPDRQATTRALLGVASLESEAAAGVETYRAFFVDGYGRDMPAVAFERRPGSAPVVTVYGAEGARMSAPVSIPTWARVQREALFADRQLTPVSPADDRLRMCLHAWVLTAEMANTTTDGHTVQPIRRRTEDACTGGLTKAFAFTLAELAVEAIAPCDAIDMSRQRNHLTVLDACLALRGDRFTAVELLNQRGRIGPEWGRDPLDVDLWRVALGINGSPLLNWAGTEVRTERSRNDRVAEFIVERIREFPDLRFDQLRFEGIDSRRGVITGEAWYRTGDQRHAAPYTQTWVWDSAMHEWMLESWRVEPFAIVP